MHNRIWYKIKFKIIFGKIGLVLMKEFINIELFGETYIPKAYRNLLSEELEIITFSNKDLVTEKKVLKHIKKNGICVVVGNWDNIIRVYSKIESIFSKELLFIQQNSKSEISNSKYNLANRLMVIIKDNNSVTQPIKFIPFLFNLIGEEDDIRRKNQYLVSVKEFLQFQESLDLKHKIRILDINLQLIKNIHMPVSESIFLLFETVLHELRTQIPNGASALDINCASGIFTIIAAKSLSEYNWTIYSTDKKVEAIGNTKINVLECERLEVISANVIKIIEYSELRLLINSRKRFELLFIYIPDVLNAKDFIDLLQENISLIKKQGYVLIGYSKYDDSGLIDLIEDFIVFNKLKTLKIYKERVRAKKSIRSWETVCFYFLTKLNGN